MKVLLDEQLPHPLRPTLVGHDVFTVRYMGWDGIENGDLLRLAEAQFDVFITADQNISYQQRTHDRNIAFVVLIVPDTRVETLLPLVPTILATLPTLQPGDVVEITPPEGS